MTSADLWIEVGNQLRDIRERAGFKEPWNVYKAGGPAVDTIEQIESGRPRTVSALDAYCTAIGTDLVAVLRQVLTPQAALDADGVRIAAVYQQGAHDPRAATLRRALMDLTRILEDQLGAQGPSPSA